MVEILSQSTDTCIGFKVSGKIKSGDFDGLLQKIDEAISTHDQINLLVFMEDFEGYASMDAAKADFEFGTHEYRQVEKAAFVGYKKWEEWMIKLVDPLTRRTEERYFDLAQLDEAWLWVKGEG